MSNLALVYSSQQNHNNIVLVDLFGDAGSNQGYMQAAVSGRRGDPKVVRKRKHTQPCSSEELVFAEQIGGH